MTLLEHDDDLIEETQVSRTVTRHPPASQPVLKALTAYASEPPAIRDPSRDAEGTGRALHPDHDEPPPSSSLLDPIPVVMVKLGDLGSVKSSEHAANVASSALSKALKAKAVLIHVVSDSESRILGSDPTTAKDPFGVKDLAMDDGIASSVMTSKRPLTLRFEDESALPRRLALLGAERSYVCVPVTIDRGRVVIVEVVDADPRFGARVLDACEYVADRLRPFLGPVLSARSA